MSAALIGRREGSHDFLVPASKHEPQNKLHGEISLAQN